MNSKDDLSNFVSGMFTCEAFESAAKNETEGDEESISQEFHPLTGLILLNTETQALFY